MSDCLQVGKLFQFITHNSAFHPFVVSKMSSGRSGWG